MGVIGFDRVAFDLSLTYISQKIVALGEVTEEVPVDTDPLLCIAGNVPKRSTYPEDQGASSVSGFHKTTPKVTRRRLSSVRMTRTRKSVWRLSTLSDSDVSLKEHVKG